jgi:hypothetical protein
MKDARSQNNIQLDLPGSSAKLVSLKKTPHTPAAFQGVKDVITMDARQSCFKYWEEWLVGK